MKLIINAEFDGTTVKDLLYDHLGYSSNIVKNLKKLPNGITVNGSHVTVRYVLRVGDELVLETDDVSESENITPIELPLDIVYEDDFLMVLNKPAGMPTHPSRNHHDDSLANSLAFYFRSLNRPFIFRAINRLDADTSGLVLVAKDKVTAFKLSRAMSEGKISKKYFALLRGPLYSSGKIELPIRRSEDSTMLRTVDTKPESGAKYALTVYDVLWHSDKYTLVSASPITGRTHQLRVHFSHIGHPICGDGLYGVTSDGSDYQRLALHAYSLTFPHPIKGEITFTTQIPDCFSI